MLDSSLPDDDEDDDEECPPLPPPLICPEARPQHTSLCEKSQRHETSEFRWILFVLDHISSPARGQRFEASGRMKLNVRETPRNPPEPGTEPHVTRGGFGFCSGSNRGAEPNNGSNSSSLPQFGETAANTMKPVEDHSQQRSLGFRGAMFVSGHVVT